MSWKKLLEKSIATIGTNRTAEKTTVSRRQLSRIMIHGDQPRQDTIDKIVAALGNGADMAKRLKDTLNEKELARIMAKKTTARASLAERSTKEKTRQTRTAKA